MPENSFLLNLLLSSPQAYLLLSYLKLKSWETDTRPLFFYIDDIRTVGVRKVLTKAQVRRNLKLLEKLLYISIDQCPYLRGARYITILEVGEENE